MRNIILFFIMFIFTSANVKADQEMVYIDGDFKSIGLFNSNESKSVEKDLCTNEGLGVQYFCDPQWKRRDIDDAVLIIISSDPAVTLTITKINSRILYMEQLTKRMLEDKALYAKGFRTRNVTFANKKAIQVKAFSRQHSGRRLLDYYFVHDGKLYAVLFSVYPKEKWDDYKFLIKKIGESFDFIDKQSILTKG